MGTVYGALLELRGQEAVFKQELLERFAVAAAQGEALVILLENYGQLSLDDILYYVDRSTEIAEGLSGQDLSAITDTAARTTDPVLTSAVDSLLDCVNALNAGAQACSTFDLPNDL